MFSKNLLPYRRLLVASSLSLTLNLTLSTVKCEERSSKPILYQYAICPFCHRVKAYLDFLKVDYTSIEVNPLTKSEIKFSDYKKVPIAIINGQTIKDSNDIIDAISKSISTNDNAAKFFSEDSKKWNEWSEKKLAVLLYPNITRTFSESWECFGYSNNVENWNGMEKVMVRVLGSVAMYFVNGKIKTKYGIVNERKELNELLLEWTNAVNKKKYLHGDHPTLPDILVFGVLHAVEGTQTHHDIMTANGDLQVWYNEVKLIATAK